MNLYAQMWLPGPTGCVSFLSGEPGSLIVAILGKRDLGEVL